MSRFKDDPKYREYLEKYCKALGHKKDGPYVTVWSFHAGTSHMHRAILMWKPPSADKYEMLDWSKPGHTKFAPARRDADEIAKQLGVRYRRAA